MTKIELVIATLDWAVQHGSDARQLRELLILRTQVTGESKGKVEDSIRKVADIYTETHPLTKEIDKLLK